MDFYCKVKLADGPEMKIEEIFRRVWSMDWIRKNASGCVNGCAVFSAFGANDKEYELWVDLEDPGQKALIRLEDQAVIFSGIPRIR